MRRDDLGLHREMVSVLSAIGRLVDAEELGATVTVVEGPDVGLKAVISFESGNSKGPSGLWKRLSLFLNSTKRPECAI